MSGQKKKHLELSSFSGQLLHVRIIYLLIFIVFQLGNIPIIVWAGLGYLTVIIASTSGIQVSILILDAELSVEGAEARVQIFLSQ